MIAKELVLDGESRPKDPFEIGFRYEQHGDKWIQVPLTERDFLHPQLDDRFMCVDAHALAMTYLRYAVETVQRDRDSVRVFMEHLVDWQEDGIPAMRPDVSVFGNLHDEWDSFEKVVPVQDLGCTPLLLIEITSPSTRRTDLEDKVPLYEQFGVPYLLFFDFYSQGSDIVDPVLIALRRGPKGYTRMKIDPDHGAWIPTVEMWFKLDENHRAVAFNAKKERIAAPLELAEMVQETKAQLEAEKQRADAEKQRADIEKQRAEAATTRAENEKQRADLLEKELAEFKAKFASQNPKTNGTN